MGDICQTPRLIKENVRFGREEDRVGGVTREAIGSQMWPCTYVAVEVWDHTETQMGN